MKAIQLLVNSVLPDELKNYEADFSEKGLNKILHAVATKYPERFADVLQDISNIGRKVSYQQGETLTLHDLAPVIDRQAIYDNMEREIAALPRDKDFVNKRREIFQKYNTFIEKETSKNALENRNNIAISVLSGARGKSAQLKAMISTPGTFSDYKGTPIDVFSKESFSDGIRPVTFLASTYGARSSVISTKSSTAKGGDLAKQMAQSVVDMVVRTNDCGSTNGISLDIEDESLKGRVLANSVGGFKEGQFITRQMIHDLKKQGITNVIARSPLTCNTPNGLCATCVGKFYSGGKLPKIGDALGAAASTAISEPVCLVKGTEVKMADGSVKKIEDIEPGEYVLGSDMNGYCKPVRVLNKFHNGPRDCYRSYIKKGYGKNSGHIILESTAAHKILGTIRSRSRSLHTAKLNIAPIGTMPDSKYTVRMCQSITGSEGGTVNEPMAMLLGMLVGDGSYKGTASGSAKHAVKLSCYDDEQVAELREELTPLNILVQEYTAEHEYRIVEANPHNTQNWIAIDGITCSERTKVRNRVRAKLIQEGMWGQDCYTKTLPKTIWTWDNESIYKFVGGLIATDGHVTKNGTIGYSSNSLKLIQQIKELLQFRLGIYSSNIASSQKRKPDGTLYNPTYKLTIDEAGSVLRFAELVHIPGRKNAILLAANRKLNGKRRGLYKLEKQEYIGVQDTWDLEVDNDTHLFALANGLIVSNTQMALSAKHTAGMTQSKKTYSGLGTITQFTQSPEKFKDKATVSELDGTVEDVHEAPQGGHYVVVSGTQHYVPAGHDVEVKPGDTVEAGDFLSEGLGDPEDIIRHKGLGAGRLYYANRLNQILADSGAKNDKRSTEILARGALRHVRIMDDTGYGQYLPDDIVDYNTLQSQYRMPETTRLQSTKDSAGKYLQQPVLHYTIGTKITPKVIKDLTDNNLNEIYVDDNEPAFKPEMIRIRAASHTNPDWMASLGTSYLTKQLNESSTKGDDTNVLQNADYRPRLAFGKDFGKNIKQTGLF